MQEQIADKNLINNQGLPEAVREQIREAYSTLKQKMPGFYERFQQRKLIAEVASTLSGQNKDKSILVAEGPTGTGKTLAYLLAAIPVAQFLEKKLVVSSATVALQEQLIFQDLPLIQNLSGYEFSMQIAKGRGRYACVSKMHSIDTGAGQDELDLGAAQWEQPPNKQEIRSINKAFKLFKDGKWNGDLDLLPIPVSRNLWPKLSNTFHGCTGSRCRDYRKCVFFKERRKIGGADVIIANHDLVLADLTAGGGTVLPPLDNSLYIFDEAHHLPGKAISHFARHASLLGSGDWLKKIKPAFNQSLNIKGASNIYKEAEAIGLELAESMRELHSLIQSLSLTRELNNKEHVRFAFGVPPQEILEYGEQKIWQPLKKLHKRLNTALELAKQDFDREEETEINLKEQQMSALGSLCGRTENLYRLWQVLLISDKKDSPPYARWISATENKDIILNVSPISAAEHLQKNLWDKTLGVILTSATLTALNSFARFNQRLGLSEDNAEYLRLPSPFDLKRVELKISDMRQSPKNHAAHTSEIIKLAPELLSQSQGALFLFSSRRQMQEVYEGLSIKLQEQILIQGDDSKQELIKRHKKRIADNLPSALFGLDSFAEGLDLPGALCEHVIIAKLPFAVPTSPIEEASAEYVESQGKNYFFSVSVPDAGIKLIQACGRLMRSETDSGQITILDNRLLSTGYGKILLKSLPPYKFSKNNNAKV